MKKQTIFYIPGLGDGYDKYRRRALKAWSFFGPDTVLMPMNWYAGGTYEERFAYASQLIAKAVGQGRRVALVSESAGASMAINLFATHPDIASLVTIAGVNATSTPVASHTLRRGPAFATSKQYVDESLRQLSLVRRHHIYTLSAWSDNVVRSKYSQIADAHNYRIWSVGHLLTIALCLTLLAGYIVHLTKRD